MAQKQHENSDEQNNNNSWEKQYWKDSSKFLGWSINIYMHRKYRKKHESTTIITSNGVEYCWMETLQLTSSGAQNVDSCVGSKQRNETLHQAITGNYEGTKRAVTYKRTCSKRSELNMKVIKYGLFLWEECKLRERRAISWYRIWKAMQFFIGEFIHKYLIFILIV